MLLCGSILTDVRRALHALRPDAAEDLLREIELRTNDEPSSRSPLLPRGRLIDEIAPAVREAFPDRSEGLLGAVQAALWPHGVIGPVTQHDPYRTPPEDEPLDDEPDSFPSLLVAEVRGPGRGLRLLLHRDSMVIGRSPGEADFSFKDLSLSRAHMRVTLDARSQVFVEDLESSNGIHVNGKRVHETWISDRDRIRCGDVELVFIAPRV